jgi:hypothetical protein
VFELSNNCHKGYVSLYFFGILAAYAILGLVVFVPGLLIPAPPLLLLIGIVLVVIVVLIFAAAIILKGLSKLFHKF